MCPAHPRSRGENKQAQANAPKVLGSSPLTRGKPSAHACVDEDSGLIPAHAGKTARSHTMSSRVRAHPRSRGENAAATHTPPIRDGSSPLTRGKRGLSATLRVRRGLIPAHAGKTSNAEMKPAWCVAHPRSRGENSGGCEPPQLPRGSSPLTRGKRRTRGREVGFDRLIPAHAGKTLPDLRFYCADRSDLGNP